MIQLQLRSDLISDVEYEVRTFLGSGVKKLGETTLEVHLPSGMHRALPILIDKAFKVDLEVRGFRELVQNLKDLKIPLAAEFGDVCD